MKKTLTYPIIRQAPAADGLQSITISTWDTDREHDRISPEGVRFENYLRVGGPVLYGHDYGGLPVAKTTGITVQPGRGLRAAFRWIEGDPFSERVRNAWAQGALGGASVGIIAHQSAPNEFGGYDILASDLVEWSLTPVPANPHAVRALKALGLWHGRKESTMNLDLNEPILTLVDEFDLKLQADQEDDLRRQARFEAAEERGSARIREFEENACRQAERFALQDQQRERAVQEWARAVGAPVGFGCPVPRHF